jgi:hypothetical protein
MSFQVYPVSPDGERPTYQSITPMQFFPGQEPLDCSQNSNIRNMYRQSFGKPTSVDATLLKRYIGKSWDSSSRLNRIKSINAGKGVYAPPNSTLAQSSTKSYNPSLVRSILKSVRNN